MRLSGELRCTNTLICWHVPCNVVIAMACPCIRSTLASCSVWSRLEEVFVVRCVTDVTLMAELQPRKRELRRPRRHVRAGGHSGR